MLSISEENAVCKDLPPSLSEVQQLRVATGIVMSCVLLVRYLSYAYNEVMQAS